MGHRYKCGSRWTFNLQERRYSVSADEPISEDIPADLNIGGNNVFYHGTGDHDDTIQIDEMQRSEDEPYCT